MKKNLFILAIALVSTSITTCKKEEPVLFVSVGKQTGTLIAGVTGSVTFAVTTENIANGSYIATVTDLPAGVSVTGDVTINAGKGTLTLTGNSSTEAGTTSSLRLTIKETQSPAFTLNIEEPPPVAVTGVTLNKTATTIAAGETETLTATVTPANATNKNVTWASNNAARATVDADGKVTVPITATAGTATITVKTVDGEKTATCTVTATPAPVAVTGVTLNKTATTIVAGGTETLTATVAPANATNKNVTWSSDNTNRATVSSSGRVTVPATATAGTVTITVTTVDGEKTATCLVTVTAAVAVTGVTLNKTVTTIAAGESETLTATVIPDNATNKNVTWSSNNTARATVSATGRVTVPATATTGTVTITVTTVDGGKTATCAVTVTAAPDGSADNPFIVNSSTTLQKVGSSTDGWTRDKHYKQTANITLSGTWTKIGSNSSSQFIGLYDGGGYSITNLNIPSATSDYQGMFGYIGASGIVRNVALINVNIKSTASYTGSIAGYNYGTIENCYVTGSVSGGHRTGGLAGQNATSGIIRNCYTTCNVASTGTLGSGSLNPQGETGGIAGINSATIQRCYATGKISTTGIAGGLVGSNLTGRIERCVALNVEVSTSGINTVGRIIATSSQGSMSNVFARQTGMTVKNGYNTLTNLTRSIDGTDIGAIYTHGAESGRWWLGAGYSLSVSFSSALWDCASNRLPHLKTTTGGDFDLTQNPVVL